MKILSIGKEIIYNKLEIINIKNLSSDIDVSLYDYIIISGGDGMIRRVVKECYFLKNIPKIILNPVGSFNFIAKFYKVDNIFKILNKIEKNKQLKTSKHKFFSLNNEIFLFSVGNMVDLQHILLSETFRFGFMKNGIFKYILSAFFLLPVYVIMTPFMLMSSKRFFIFTLFNSIKKGSNINIDLDNNHNILELDGDIIIIKDRYLIIKEAGVIDIIVS